MQRVKSYLLAEFEENTKNVPRPLRSKSINIWQNSSNYQMATRKILSKSDAAFDHTVNITWVMQHLNVAIKYIEHSERH
jgi:tryptophan 2,3-dioxygenase